MKHIHFHNLHLLLCSLSMNLGIFLPCKAQQPNNKDEVYFRRITQTRDIQSDGIYLLISEDEKHSFLATSNDGYLSVDITCTPAGIYQGKVNENRSSDPYEFILESSQGKYIIKFHGTTDTYIVNVKKNSLSHSTWGLSNIYKWNITFDNEGFAQICTTDNSYKLYYNDNNKDTKPKLALADNSDTETNNYQRISIYRKEHLINVSEATGGYATFYNNGFSYVMPPGFTGYAVKGIGADNQLSLNAFYTQGNVVPQSTALLLYTADPGDHIATAFDTHTQGTSVTNYMEGTRDSEGYTLTTQKEEIEYFKLGLGPNKNRIGFYWGAENGDAFKMTKPTTAYLALPKKLLVDKQVLSLPVNPTTTGINHPETKIPSADIYDLSGRKVTNPQRGVYVKQGRKYIIK